MTESKEPERQEEHESVVSLKLREQSFKEKTVESVKWETSNTSGSVYVGKGKTRRKHHSQSFEGDQIP